MIFVNYCPAGLHIEFQDPISNKSVSNEFVQLGRSSWARSWLREIILKKADLLKAMLKVQGQGLT